MPGLVKVGKTLRRPSDRAQELSAVTGVASPFIVAFEEPCSDCDAVELAIHAELERMGFRVAQNREFFRAEPSDVIRIVIKNATAINALTGQEARPSTLDFPRADPWSDLLNEADALFEGDDDTIQDVDEAIRIYKSAAQMGSTKACNILGSIYFFGLEAKQDYKESLLWLNRGIKLGDFDCYIMMARVFCEQVNFDNGIKALRKFFQGKNFEDERHVAENENDLENIRQYVHICLDYGLPIEFPQYIATAREEILSRVIPRLGDEISLEERRELNLVRLILLSTMPSTEGN